MPNEAFEGGCICGKTRYHVAQGPRSTAICHCRSCQKAAGAESVAWGVFSLAEFRWAGVKPKTFHSSEGVTRAFCAECGSSLTYQVKDDAIDIALATLDDPERVVPDKEIWLSHRISWNATNDALPGFQSLGA